MRSVLHESVLRSEDLLPFASAPGLGPVRELGAGSAPALTMSHGPGPVNTGSQRTAGGPGLVVDVAQRPAPHSRGTSIVPSSRTGIPGA